MEKFAKEKLQEAIELRKNDKGEESLGIFKELLELDPNNAELNFQTATTYDFLGKESSAVQYYEKAIALGLVKERSRAFLGLGSTYRCLGEYTKSLEMLDQALVEFPEDRALRVFRALTLYNLRQSDEAMKQILLQLVETTEDQSIKKYRRALEFYSDKLHEVWK